MTAIDLPVEWVVRERAGGGPGFMFLDDPWSIPRQGHSFAGIHRFIPISLGTAVAFLGWWTARATARKEN